MCILLYVLILGKDTSSSFNTYVVMLFTNSVFFSSLCHIVKRYLTLTPFVPLTLILPRSNGFFFLPGVMPRSALFLKYLYSKGYIADEYSAAYVYVLHIVF